MTDIPTPAPTRFIGCDVAQKTIVVFDSLDQRSTTIANTPKDLKAFAASLDNTCLVVCEATGGHEAALLHAVLSAGRAAHRADARKVKAFIRSFGVLGKTDQIDARGLSRYGQERHDQLRRWQAPDLDRDRLQSLVLARRDFVDQRVACKNRISAPNSKAVQPYLKRLLRLLDTEIAAMEAELKALIKDNETLKQDTETVRSLSGIGFVTAVSLLALMPELGTMDRKKAASLAGLAPHPRQSGTMDGYRSTRGGRPEVKKVLFMAALTASRYEPKLAAFYQRLIARGKKPISAMTAVMRKLVVICNARLRKPEMICA